MGVLQQAVFIAVIIAAYSSTTFMGPCGGSSSSSSSNVMLLPTATKNRAKQRQLTYCSLKPAAQAELDSIISPSATA
jgi:hypothetical protein